MGPPLFGRMGRQYGGDDEDQLQSKVIAIPRPPSTDSRLGPGPSLIESMRAPKANDMSPPDLPLARMKSDNISRPPKPMSTWDRVWAPTYKVQRHDRAMRAYEAEQAAQQQAQAAEVKRLKLASSIGKLKGMTPEAADFFSYNPEQFFENYAENYGFNDIAAGNTYSMFGQTHQAPEKLMTVGQNEGVFDPNGRDFAVDVPEAQPDLPTGMRSDGSGGWMYDQDYLEGQERLRQAGKAVTNVNLPGTKSESAFATGRGKQAAERYQDVMTAGQSAQQNMSDISSMETALDMIDYTGFGGDTILGMQRLGAMLGVDVGNDVPPKEIAQRLTAKMGLALKSDLPGPMSDGDRQFLISIPPNINMSPEANDAMLYIMRKRNEFEQEMERSLYQANPQTYEEFDQWERNFRQSYGSLFSPEDRAALGAALGGY